MSRSNYFGSMSESDAGSGSVHALHRLRSQSSFPRSSPQLSPLIPAAHHSHRHSTRTSPMQPQEMNGKSPSQAPEAEAEAETAGVTATRTNSRRANRPRIRATNACRRCRRQKIKCNGLKPCGQCSKRNLPCVYDDRRVVSQSFVRDLERRVAAYEGRGAVGGNGELPTGLRRQPSWRDESDEGDDDGEPGIRGAERDEGGDVGEFGNGRAHTDMARNSDRPVSSMPPDTRSHSPMPRLMNPLGLERSTFALDTQGRPSEWISRRMACDVRVLILKSHSLSRHFVHMVLWQASPGLGPRASPQSTSPIRTSTLGGRGI
jgi:hypothetical protein